MRIIFMGTPEYAVPSLKRLIDSAHEVVAVVSQPDRPRGRGQKTKPSAVKAEAEKNGIPVHTPKNFKTEESEMLLSKHNPDLIVVVAFGQILPESVLTAAPHGCINAHGSILPKYRGAAPMQRAIMLGEDKTGVTIIQLVKEMDAGPMLWKKDPNTFTLFPLI